MRVTREIIEDVVPYAPPEGEAGSGPRVRVLGCPARDKADELALTMFRQIVDPTRFDVQLTSADVLASEVMAAVETNRPAVVCLSLLPPGGLAQTRYLCKRLRARYPELKILVGRWGHREGGGAEHWDLLLSAGADHVSASVLETRDHLAQVASLQPAAPVAA